MTKLYNKNIEVINKLQEQHPIQTNISRLYHFKHIIRWSDINLDKLSKPSWIEKALYDFNRVVGAKDFPCLFGKKALNSKSLFISTCSFESNCKYEDLKSILEEYTEFVKLSLIEDRVFSPLVVFFDPRFMHQNPHQIGWDALNWLHLQDTRPWPANIPINPDEPEWSFCFNEVPLFINMSTNKHKTLRSRNLGHNLILIINPRENFDFVASIKTKSGRLIREKIRSRVVSFNNHPLPIDLGFYGNSDNLEWKQYQLIENNLERPSTCPFKNKKYE